MDFTNNNIKLNIDVDVIKNIMLNNKDSINNDQLDFLINYKLNNL